MAKKKTDAAAAPDMSALPATAPKSTDLLAEVNTALADMFVTDITSPLMYELAATELVELKAKYEQIEAQRFAITRPLDAAKAAVMALFKPPLEKLEQRITALKQGMLAFKQAEKAKAAAKQVLLEKVAEGQRAALAQEQARMAAEARAEQERAEALLAEGNAAAAAEALTRAEAAQEMAVAFNETAAVVSAAVAATDVPMVDGVNTADVWKARVVDLPALLRFIADHPEYHHWIELKPADLNEMARAQRTALRVPGVEAFEESRIAAGRGLRKAA